MGNNFCAGRSDTGGQFVVFQRQVASDKLGHYTWSCVWGYRGACLEALRRAEEKTGRPPFVLEVSQEWNSMIPKIATMIVHIGLQDLIRNDEIMADPNHERFTLNPGMQSTESNPTDFMLFSDRFVTVFPGY